MTNTQMTDDPRGSSQQSAIRNPQSVLAVHPGALGDVILFGRLLSMLPGPITLVTGREKGELLAGVGVVRKVLDFDALPMHEAFTDTPLSQCRLPKLVGRHRRLISCFAGGDRKAQLRLAAMCGSSDAVFLPVRPTEGFQGHLLDLWTDMLRVPSSARGSQGGTACGLAGRGPWAISSSWREKARALLRDVRVDPGRPYFVLHPGSGSPKKCWPVERFVELAELLVRGAGTGPRRKSGVGSVPDHAVSTTPDSHRGLAGPEVQPRGGRESQVVFVLGPVECERWTQERVAGIQRELPVILCPPLTTLAGLLEGASGYVGNDSGVSHLAAAVGAPTVAIFGPTRPEHFAPVGPKVGVVRARSLRRISAQQVVQVLQEVVGP